MCNRVFTTPVSVKYVAVTVASEMEIDNNGEAIYPTIGIGSEARTTVTPDPIMLVRIPATVLRYRETDIPADFVPAQGAQIPLKQTDYFEEIFQMVPASNSASHDLRIAFISVMALFFGLGIFIFLWTMFRRRQSRRKKRPDSEHQWFLGAGVYSASVIGIFTGIFAVMYASRKKWQEETIQVFGSPNAVRLCVQVMAFIMRTCATVLAWVVVAGIGWLSLARGMGRAELLKTLDMTATGGTYR